MDATALPIHAFSGLSAGPVLCPQAEDAHWQRVHGVEACEPPGLDYEDYAPAYCVGYVGCAQYGGAFDDALPSLWANWTRVKGDSRLSQEQALLAMRAAWDRVAAQVGQGRGHGHRRPGRREDAAPHGHALVMGTVLAERGSSPGISHAPSFPV